MNCPICDALTQPNHNFCARCGARLTRPASSTPPSHQSVGAVSEPSLPPAATYQYPVAEPSPPKIRRAVTTNRGRTSLLTAIGSLVLLGALSLLAVLAWSASLRRPDVVDPSAVLEKARASLGAVKSARYQAEAGFYGIDTSGSAITSTRPLTVAIEGELQMPESFTLNSGVPQLGDNIAIGDTIWTRRNNSTQWSEQDLTTMSLGLINPLTFLNYLRYPQEGTAVLIGSEQRGDATVHRIRFPVDKDRMSAETNDPSLRSILATSRVDADAWIEDKSYFVERIVLSVESDDGTGVLIRANFSDYNSPVEISPPVQ